MRRSSLVIAGTVAGAAGVLAFPVSHARLVVPSAAASGAASPSPTTSSSTTAPSNTGSAVTSAPTTVPAVRSATGTEESFRYGDLAVTVTVDGQKVTNVSMATLQETDGRSYQIDSYAIPQLERQAIAAGSANIDGVSGATFTSQAFADSLASALAKLGVK